VSPASGEKTARLLLQAKRSGVSIQLVSPASGEASIIHSIQRKPSRCRLRGSGIIAKNPTVTHP
ncbi:MAG: hypothetical protein ABI262_17110, partial [Microcoleus sp.]